MKTLSIFLGLILVLVTGIFAAPPTNAVTNAAYEFGGIDVNLPISSAAGFDTLAAVDSSTLIVSKPFGGAGQGWEYILVRDAITGTGSDSVKIQVVLDALDGKGVLLYRTAIDSFTTSGGESVLLPVYTTSIGSSFRIKLISYTDNGGQVILNRFYVYKRRPLISNINWK